MTASKKAAIFVLQALLNINVHIPPHSRQYSTFNYIMAVKLSANTFYVCPIMVLHHSFPFDVLASLTIFLIEFNRNEIESFDVEESRIQQFQLRDDGQAHEAQGHDDVDVGADP